MGIKIRCKNVCCNQVVDMSQGFKRVENDLFCSISCANDYLRQSQRFDYTARRPPGQPALNYKSKAWWKY
jgi:hypothetical protein